MIADLTAYHPDLALIPTIESVPDVTIQVMPHAGTDPETQMFFFLVEDEGAGFDRFEEALQDDHTVEESSLVSDAPTTRIYRLGHPESTKLVTPKTTEVGGIMREAKSTTGAWQLRLQLPDREPLSRLWDYCNEEGIELDLVRLYQQHTLDGDEQVNLTTAQRKTLLTAYEEGYFEEPRETSHEGLAEILDISPTAVGGRIRRGVSELIEAVLVEDE